MHQINLEPVHLITADLSVSGAPDQSRSGVLDRSGSDAQGLIHIQCICSENSWSIFGINSDPLSWINPDSLLQIQWSRHIQIRWSQDIQIVFRLILHQEWLGIFIAVTLTNKSTHFKSDDDINVTSFLQRHKRQYYICWHPAEPAGNNWLASESRNLKKKNVGSQCVKQIWHHHCNTGVRILKMLDC